MADQWLAIADAAQALGISIDAARRRVRNGSLAAEKRATPQGGAWWVLVPDGAQRHVAGHQAPGGNGEAHQEAAVQQGGSAGTVAAVDGIDLQAGLIQLVGELTARLDGKHEELLARTEAAAMWQARAEMLAGELADARVQVQQRDEQLKALQAPQQEPPTQEPPATAVLTEEPPAAFQPGRWRRVWRWLVAVD
jgi:hypothetical protein